MQADLYIRTLHEAHRAEMEFHIREAIACRDQQVPGSDAFRVAQEDAEFWFARVMTVGYFCDMYRNSLLANLGLSWCRDVLPLLNDRDELSPRHVKWLLNEVRSRRISRQERISEELENVVRFEGNRGLIRSLALQLVPYDLSEVVFLIDRKAQFIQFLMTALDRREAVVCSL